MKRYVSSNSSCSSSSRLTICAWIETSSAETGSSHTMKPGSARARARARSAAAGRPRTRAGTASPRRPGARRRSSSSRTRRAVSRRVGEPVDAQRLADDPADAVARVERRERILEDHLHLPADVAHARLARRSVMSSPVEHDPAAGRLVEADDRPPEVDLPQPDSPTRPSVSPRSIVNDTPSTAFTSPT